MASVLTSVCLLLSSCSLDDYRDECCDQTTGIIMKHRYLYKSEDVFPEHIRTLHHYLFAADGSFLSMLPPGEQLQSQPLDLKPGTYTMVSVGNVSEQFSFEGHAEGGLDGFLLRVLGQDRQRNAAHSIVQKERQGGEPQAFRCGELYSGYSQFTVTDAPVQRFRTDMSNIHCQLDVRVEWENRPPAVGDYRISLQNVPCCYNMDHKDIVTVSGYDFPADDGSRDEYQAVVPLQSQTLTASFVTLRYTSECLPVLAVHLGDQAVAPSLDLMRAFQQWGWNPDKDTVQHYRIRILIRSDGSVVVRPWVDGEVLDWIDGGIFS